MRYDHKQSGNWSQWGFRSMNSELCRVNLSHIYILVNKDGFRRCAFDGVPISIK